MNWKKINYQSLRQHIKRDLTSRRKIRNRKGAASIAAATCWISHLVCLSFNFHITKMLWIEMRDQGDKSSNKRIQEQVEETWIDFTSDGRLPDEKMFWSRRVFLWKRKKRKKDKEARITPQALKGRLAGFPFSTLFRTSLSLYSLGWLSYVNVWVFMIRTRIGLESADLWNQRSASSFPRYCAHGWRVSYYTSHTHARIFTYTATTTNTHELAI